MSFKALVVNLVNVSLHIIILIDNIFNFFHKRFKTVSFNLSSYECYVKSLTLFNHSDVKCSYNQT